MNQQAKIDRYDRIISQLKTLLSKSSDEQARMASVVALIHHKMPRFFWTGFYELKQGRLVVKLYQGAIACMELPKDTGVCWAAINSAKSIIVPNVNEFPGHIACDSRSKSEICIPYWNAEGVVTAVLDIDSDYFDNFNDIDEAKLSEILTLINSIEATGSSSDHPD